MTPGPLGAIPGLTRPPQIQPRRLERPKFAGTAPNGRPDICFNGPRICLNGGSGLRVVVVKVVKVVVKVVVNVVVNVVVVVVVVVVVIIIELSY